MVRAKRSLAEADSNAELAPAPKKASTRKAKGKGNSAPAARKESAGKAEEIARNAPITTITKRNRSEAKAKMHDEPVEESASTSKSKGKQKDTSSGKAKGTTKTTSEQVVTKSQTSSVPKDKDGKVPQSADGKTWICICRPPEEIAEDLGVDEDDEAVSQACDGGNSCVCKKPADDYPEHQWIVTKKGFELTLEWQTQQAKRDQDYFDMHVFSDWSGYGICEVIENMLLAFAKEEKKKKNSDVLAMWSVVESMALTLNGDLMAFHMIDDAEGNAKRVMLIGTALLATIDALIKKDLFKNGNSEIRNIGLVLSHFLRFVAETSETCRLNEDGWKAEVVKKADEHGVTIQGLSGVDELIESIYEGVNDSESEESGQRTASQVVDELMNMTTCYKSEPMCGTVTVEMLTRGTRRSWQNWDWAMELDAYSHFQAVKVGPTGPSYGGKIGGNFYDLTAKHNKGPRMKRYMLGGGGYGDESE